MNNTSDQICQFIPKHYSLIHEKYITDQNDYDGVNYQGMSALLLVYEIVDIHLTTKPKDTIECKVLVKDNSLYMVIQENKYNCFIGEELKVISHNKTKKPNVTYYDRYMLHIIVDKNILVEIYLLRNEKFVIPKLFNNISLYEILNNNYIGHLAYLTLENLPDYPIKCRINSSMRTGRACVTLCDFYRDIRPGSVLTLANHTNSSILDLLYIISYSDYARLYVKDVKNDKPDGLPNNHVALRYDQLQNSVCYSGELGVMCIFERDGTTIIPCMFNICNSITILKEYRKYPSGTAFNLRRIDQFVEMMTYHTNSDLCKVYIPVHRL